MLLYLGSLAGIHLGVYGVKVVNESYIRMVTSLIILLCVFSRVIAIPVYLRQLEVISFDPDLDQYFNGASKFFLFASGISGALVILMATLFERIDRGEKFRKPCWWCGIRVQTCRMTTRVPQFLARAQDARCGGQRQAVNEGGNHELIM